MPKFVKKQGKIASGKQRTAFRGTCDGKTIVVKVGGHPERDCREQMEVRHAAHAFNKARKGKGHDLSVLRPELAKDEEGQTVLIEDELPGNFQKFNDMDQPRSSGHWEPDAFSHFSYFHFKKKKVVVDLQGCHHHGNYMISDPGFRHGNDAKNWMNMHQCNDLCRKMKLGRI